MNKEIVFAGFGGQGILTAGLVVAQIALYNGYKATWTPAYGATMRGGTANCTVKYGDEIIYCPIQETPDILLAMNYPSLERFSPIVAEGGIIIYNSDMIAPNQLSIVRPDIKIIGVPCITLAAEVDHPKGANIVMVGKIMEQLGEPSRQQCINGMNDMFRKKGKDKFEELNVKAFNRGYDFQG